jgi:hypothetical protein
LSQAKKICRIIEQYLKMTLYKALSLWYNTNKYRGKSMMSNLSELATAIDLRHVVERYWGTGKAMGDQSVRYPARWKGGDNATRFAVYPTHFYDYKDGDHGDVFDFLKQELKTDFKGALNEARKFLGKDIDVEQLSARQIPVQYGYKSPPDAVWQEKLSAEVRRCSDYLQIMPNAAPVREYLTHTRGISEDQQYYARFGYNPTWRRLDVLVNGRTVWLPPGIVIPRFEYGIMFGVRIRLMTGKVAEKTKIVNDEMGTQKYSSATGSRHALAVAGESGLKNGATVLFCEGEFDRAVLLDQLSQTGEAVTILTMGSASQRIPTRLIGKLRLAKAIYLCLDADEAGRTASEKLARQLGMNRCYLLPFPDGSKDACDYYETAGANAIREWWVNRVAHRAKVVL